MRIRPLYEAPPVAVFIGNGAYDSFRVIEGTHTDPDEIFKLTYIQFMFSLYAPYIHKSFRTHVIIPPAYYYCDKWAKMCLVKLFMALESKMGFGYIVGKLIICGFRNQ